MYSLIFEAYLSKNVNLMLFICLNLCCFSLSYRIEINCDDG